MQNDEVKYFAVIFPNPRPTFPRDLSDDEKKIVEEHRKFWRVLIDEGRGIISGPILKPNAAFGFSVLTADSAEHAASLVKDDPMQLINRYEIYQMMPQLP
ncbi:MAG: YciI family protein [Methanomassiliicoccaceae archaeon]|nr:YciI family protein [Methanomassiliicoccaceae archaeon]